MSNFFLAFRTFFFGQIIFDLSLNLSAKVKFNCPLALPTEVQPERKEVRGGGGERLREGTRGWEIGEGREARKERERETERKGEREGEREKERGTEIEREREKRER
jgi:hypothetical protein